MTRAFSWFYHFAWGLGLSILTLVWTTGAKQRLGGWVVDFLSHPVFEPLYRLTYGVYLIHLLVLPMLMLPGGATSFPHYSDYWLMSTWISASVVSYLFALVMYLCIEYPCGQLWDLASGRSKSSSGMNVKQTAKKANENEQELPEVIPTTLDAGNEVESSG